MKSHAQKMGLSTLFYLNLFFPNDVTRPKGYSQERMNALIAKYNKQKTTHTQREQPNIIIFFIEAFTDPTQSGIKTNIDSIPFFRALSQNHNSGNLIVPVIGGKSANSEFELLTGFSMRYLPKGSIPYIDYINKPVSSMVTELKNNGYATYALHVASLAFFNYKVAYPNIGFESIKTLHNQKKITKDIANRFPSEGALVNQIVETIKDEDKPTLIFSFPNSTHGFWDYQGYEKGPIEILNTDISEVKEIKTYTNALHTADKAINQLVSSFENSKEKTVILIMGDHYPGIFSYLKNNLRHKTQNFQNIDLSKKNEHTSWYRFIKKNHPIDFYSSQHKVPYVLWTNFQTEVTRADYSLNLIHSKLLKLASIHPTPFFQLTKKMQETIKEFSMIINHNNQYSTTIPSAFKKLTNDYELFQYDMLHGENYYGEWLSKQ